MIIAFIFCVSDFNLKSLILTWVICIVWIGIKFAIFIFLGFILKDCYEHTIIKNWISKTFLFFWFMCLTRRSKWWAVYHVYLLSLSFLFSIFNTNSTRFIYSKTWTPFDNIWIVYTFHKIMLSSSLSSRSNP